MPTLASAFMNSLSSLEYDLAIVGGGPAGATAALFARRLGLKTVLVDKERFPRDKVCGDAISGKSISILDELGLVEAVRDLPGAAIDEVVFGSPGHTDARIDLRQHDHHDELTGRVLPCEGFVVRRQVFDAFLFEQARAVVDDCCEGFAVKDLLRDESGAVCGLRGQLASDARLTRDGVERSCEGERELELRARVVLGCDGFNSVVARRTGVYQHDGRHWVVALRCYYENVTGLRDQIELHFVDEVLPGYFWIFPLENGCANVGIGMLHSALKSRDVKLKQALQEVIARPPFAERFAGARALEEPVGWNLPVGSIHRRCHGDGFMLLGDAAGLIDPFTGEGIGNALYSARIAVEVAAEAIAAGDCGAATLQRYDERLWDAIGHELKISTRLQKLGSHRSLLDLVIRKAATSPAIGDLISGMIANAVPKKQLTNPLFYLKLLFR